MVSPTFKHHHLTRACEAIDSQFLFLFESRHARVPDTQMRQIAFLRMWGPIYMGILNAADSDPTMRTPAVLFGLPRIAVAISSLPHKKMIDNVVKQLTEHASKHPHCVAVAERQLEALYKYRAGPLSEIYHVSVPEKPEPEAEPDPTTMSPRRMPRTPKRPTSRRVRVVSTPSKPGPVPTSPQAKLTPKRTPKRAGSTSRQTKSRRVARMIPRQKSSELHWAEASPRGRIRGATQK